MIRLFRKLRNNLLSEKKYGIYILYAAGEIVLVMIGILLALQIDNWNEDRKDRRIEITLLGNIKKDLESDIQEFRNVKQFKKSQNEAGHRLLEYLIDASKPLEDTVQFVNDLHLIVYFVVPSSNRTSFDIATNTGYLNNITNDSLVNELSKYFNDIGLEQHVTDTKRFTNAFNETYLMNKYLLFSKYVRPLDGQGGDYALERYINDPRSMVQLNDIRGDISLENYLNELSIRLIIGMLGLEKEERIAQNLIRKIEGQLNF